MSLLENYILFFFRYKEEFIPILKDCDCLGCSNHTQAYVHHLITTNELLAPMILTM